MSIDVSSPQFISPNITVQDKLDITADTLDDTTSDLMSDCSRVWTAKHSDAVNARISSSKQHLLGVGTKKSLEEMSNELPTVFMEVTQEVSFDILATEFLTNSFANIDTRVFLLDKVIPCLAVSVQRLLKQVEKLDVVNMDVRESGFNPINFLAQQLMRNNPRYNTAVESSPYVVGIRVASDEMRRRMFAMEESRLAKIKADAKKRREERQQQKFMKKQREEYRYRELQKCYEDFAMIGFTSLPRLPIYSSLTSFVERLTDVEYISMDNYSVPEREEFVSTLLVSDGTEFAVLLMPSVSLVSTDLFEVFRDHLKDCGSSYRLSLIREKRKDVLGNVFKSIDERVDGKLNRHRIVQLFTSFYEHSDSSTQNTLVDPKNFGISEFEQEIINESYQQDNSDSDNIKDESQILAPLPIDMNTDIVNGDSAVINKLTENGSVQPDTLQQNITDVVNGITSEINQTTDPIEQTGESTAPEYVEAETKEPGIPEVEIEANEHKESVTEQNADIPTVSLTKECNGISNGDEVAIDQLESTENKESESSKQEESKDIIQENSGINIEEVLPKVQTTELENQTIKQNGNGQTSAPVSASNLNAIQEESDGESPIPNGGDTGLPSLDVTIAIEDTMFESQNTTQDLQTNLEKQKGSLSESRVLSIKASQTLRAKVLSRLANIDPSPIRTRTNTPLDYNSPGLPWNVDFISIEQFSQLTEFFWGTCPQPKLVESILTFIKDGYIETEYEREERIREDWLQKLRLNQNRTLMKLYTVWDNDRSGSINREEFKKIISSWPRQAEYALSNIIQGFLGEFRFQTEDEVTKEEFISLLADICIRLEGESDFLEYTEFIQKSIKLNHEEKERGMIRTGWLENIITISRTCGLSFDTIFKTALGCIYKDNELHGMGKRARCNVGLLEYFQGNKALHYVTASQDDQDGVVGKVLKEDQKNVGFSVINNGRMIHIPKILETKQKVHLFYPKRKTLDKSRDGSFLCCPLLHPRGHVIGVLGVDTLAEIEKKSFIPHEVAFYQGVAKVLGEAYSHIELRIKLVKILHSAFRWTLSKIESINSITVLIVEDPPADRTNAGYILRRVLTMHQGERDPVEDPNAPRIFRLDDVFKEYLFECAENSEPTSRETFGRLHWTVPVRDNEGSPMAVIDIEIKGLLSKPEEENIHWMARLVTIAVIELSQGFREPPKPHMLEAEGIDEENRLAVLFSRLLLTDLRRNVEKLDAEAYAEIKSYIDPPKVIHDVLRAVLYIFNPDKLEASKQWRSCKQSVNIDLSKSISTYDPTSRQYEVQVRELQDLLSIVPVGDVEKHGSLPAKCLHDWSLVCLSLLEHTERMKEAFWGKGNQ